MSNANPCRINISRLTAAEENVYQLIGLGLTNEEIAAELYISPLTVRTHVKRIHAKLDIHGRARLAIASHKAHWASPNRFAGAIELLKRRGSRDLNAEAIAVLAQAGQEEANA